MPESVGSSGSVVLTPKPASITISASAPTLEVKFSAEHWQFFAFVFGACLTRGFSLLDEIPGEFWDYFGARWITKARVFGGLGYLFLLDWDVERWLSHQLPLITTKTW